MWWYDIFFFFYGLDLVTSAYATRTRRTFTKRNSVLFVLMATFSREQIMDRVFHSPIQTYKAAKG
jgi:hypothetical protein